MTDLTFEQLCELFNFTPKKRLLDTKEVAEILGVHQSTVDHYRQRGVGPRHFSPPGTRRVWYSERDLLFWMLTGLRHSSSEQPGETLALQTVNTPAYPTDPRCPPWANPEPRPRRAALS